MHNPNSQRDEYLLRAEKARAADARSKQAERDFADGKILNGPANEAMHAARLERNLFKLWIFDNHAALFGPADAPAPTKPQEELKDKILAERAKGNLVYAHIEGYSVVSVEDFVKQPVDGMLYDLNRGEEVSLSFISEKKWVNDFAVALTIRKLVEQRDALEKLRREGMDEKLRQAQPEAGKDDAKCSRCGELGDGDGCQDPLCPAGYEQEERDRANVKDANYIDDKIDKKLRKQGSLRRELAFAESAPLSELGDIPTLKAALAVVEKHQKMFADKAFWTAESEVNNCAHGLRTIIEQKERHESAERNRSPE